MNKPVNLRILLVLIPMLLGAPLAGAVAASPTPAATRRIVDGNRRSVDFSSAPNRIASASVASDEVVHEILRRAGKLSRLVAVSSFADNRRFSNIASLSSDVKLRVSGEPEAIISTKPDLVLIAGFNRPELLKTLEKARIKTFVVGPFNGLKDILNHIETMGQILHEETIARGLSSEVVADLHSIRNLIPQRVRSAPSRGVKVMSYSADGTVMGLETTFDSIVRAAGGVNLAGKMKLTGWPKIDPEKLATLRPDFIVAMGSPNDAVKIAARIKSQAGWRSMPAAKAGRVIVIPESELLALSQHVTKAARRLAIGMYGAQPLQATSKASRKHGG